MLGKQKLKDITIIKTCQTLHKNKRNWNKGLASLLYARKTQRFTQTPSSLRDTKIPSLFEEPLGRGQVAGHQEEKDPASVVFLYLVLSTFQMNRMSLPFLILVWNKLTKIE